MSVYRDALAQCNDSETVSGAGALTVAKAAHFLSASGDFTATLAAGQPGQLKFIKAASVSSHTVTVTPASARSFTSYQFTATGQWLLMRYRDNAWEVLDNSGATKVA